MKLVSDNIKIKDVFRTGEVNFDGFFGGKIKQGKASMGISV